MKRVAFWGRLLIPLSCRVLEQAHPTNSYNSISKATGADSRRFRLAETTLISTARNEMVRLV
jgi:hypothetical protein